MDDGTRSSRTLIIVGAGGHGRVCAEIAASTGRYASIVFSDPAHPVGTRIAGYTVLFHDENLPKLDVARYEIILGIGQIDADRIRNRMYARFRDLGFSSPALLAPTSYRSPSTSVGAGSMVGHHAVLNTGASIGENCIVNSHALVEHDAVVGNHVHIATGAIVNGDCTVGERTLVGSGAILRQGVRICADTVVGAGAVVVTDIEDPGTYVGIPARRITDE